MRRFFRERAVRLGILLLLATPPAGLAAAANDPPISENAAVERLLTADRVDPDWFDPAFLARVPAAQVAAIVASLRQRYGGFRAARIERGRGSLRLARAEVPVRIALNPDGRVIGLFFGVPALTDAGPAELVAQFATLADEVSVLVRRGDAALAEREPDRPLAVGSAFKLAILKVYEDQVAAGALTRDRVVPLRPAWRSVPSGMLQDWPADTPLTLETLAAMMIALSDNTATDAMLDILGRDAVETVSPRNRPFLTTREAALIKAGAASGLLRRYRAGGTVERRRLLATLADRELGDIRDFGTTPTPDIEWFFTTRELCDLLDGLFATPAVAINPGPVDASAWVRVAYKGGSELGVLNLTAAAEGGDGARVCASVTLNAGRAIDRQRATVLFASLFQALRSPD